MLREFYRAGVRYMTLTHTNTNHWADSSGTFYLPDFNPAAAVHHDEPIAVRSPELDFRTLLD